MTRVMVRYRVKPERVAENERYLKKVFEQLDREQPTGLSYASLKLGDGVSSDHGSRLRELSAFRAFTATIKERCDESPVATRLEEVGSYRLFGDGML
jgi:hypothetical protein